MKKWSSIYVYFFKSKFEFVIRKNVSSIYFLKVILAVMVVELDYLQNSLPSPQETDIHKSII